MLSLGSYQQQKCTCLVNDMPEVATTGLVIQWATAVLWEREIEASVDGWVVSLAAIAP